MHITLFTYSICPIQPLVFSSTGINLDVFIVYSVLLNPSSSCRLRWTTTCVDGSKNFKIWKNEVRPLLFFSNFFSKDGFKKKRNKKKIQFRLKSSVRLIMNEGVDLKMTTVFPYFMLFLCFQIYLDLFICKVNKRCTTCT